MRAAGALLIVAGLLVVVGAQAPWVTCSELPCSAIDPDQRTLALQVIFVRSGFEVGWGYLTAALGALIVGAGAFVTGRPAVTRVAMAAGLAVVAIGVGFALRVWVVPEYESYGPQIGFIATALGGLIAAVGDRTLRAIARRPSRSRDA
jgi:hypothetical protein